MNSLAQSLFRGVIDFPPCLLKLVLIHRRITTLEPTSPSKLQAAAKASFLSQNNQRLEFEAQTRRYKRVRQGKESHLVIPVPSNDIDDVESTCTSALTTTASLTVTFKFGSLPMITHRFSNFAAYERTYEAGGRVRFSQFGSWDASSWILGSPEGYSRIQASVNLPKSIWYGLLHCLLGVTMIQPKFVES